jgi:hypothetical protein
MTVPKQKKSQKRSGTKKNHKKHIVTQLLRDNGLPTTLTLLDLRGSVLVSGPQDFDAIRKQVSGGMFVKINGSFYQIDPMNLLGGKAS